MTEMVGAELIPARMVNERARRRGLGIARRMIEGKIRNCRSLLRRNARGEVTGTLDPAQPPRRGHAHGHRLR
jgi:hypothetical protein